MARIKKDVIVCDTCGHQQITEEPKNQIDLDAFGLTLKGGFYAGRGGGGPLTELFFCSECTESLSLSDLAEIACHGLEDWKRRN